MENRGIVLRVDGDQAEVEAQPVSGGCGRCHEEGGCGSNLLNQSLRPGQRNVYRLSNTIKARVGDTVIIRVAEGAVLRAALWAYLLPELLLIAGTALGKAWSLSGDERLPLLGAVSGLLLGLMILRWFPGRRPHRNPALSMCLAADGDATNPCSRGNT